MDKNKERKLTITIVVNGLSRSDYAKAIIKYEGYLVIDWQDGSTDRIWWRDVDDILVTA